MRKNGNIRLGCVCHSHRYHGMFFCSRAARAVRTRCRSGCRNWGLQPLTSRPMNKTGRWREGTARIKIDCIKTVLLTRYSQHHGNVEDRIKHNRPDTFIDLQLHLWPGDSTKNYPIRASVNYVLSWWEILTVGCVMNGEFECWINHCYCWFF